jgi:hypothetical protein
MERSCNKSMPSIGQNWGFLCPSLPSNHFLGPECDKWIPNLIVTYHFHPFSLLFMLFDREYMGISWISHFQTHLSDPPCVTVWVLLRGTVAGAAMRRGPFGSTERSPKRRQMLEVEFHMGNKRLNQIWICLNMFECGDASALQIVNTWHMITVWSILKLLDGQLVDNQSILWSYPTASILRCQCIRCLRHNFRLALVQSQYLSSAKMRKEFLPNWRGFNVFRNQQKSFPSACGLGYPD